MPKTSEPTKRAEIEAREAASASAYVRPDATVGPTFDEIEPLSFDISSPKNEGDAAARKQKREEDSQNVKNKIVQSRF